MKLWTNDERGSFVLNGFQKFLFFCIPVILVMLIISNIALAIATCRQTKELRSKSLSLYLSLNAPAYLSIGDSLKEPVGKHVTAPYSSSILNDIIKKREIKNNRQILDKNQKLDYSHLYNTAKRVVGIIPEIRAEAAVIKLIVETAIAETHGGLNYNVVDQGGLGITQMNYSTVRHMLSALKKTKPHIYEALELFRDENLSLRENIIRNLEYNLALCVSYYYYRKGDSLYNLINTKHDRATLWKEVYNTYLGKGTPEIYKSRVTSY